ncbi:hypothetical protein BWQ92_22975 [Arthrobacter sp. QXT-31]|nr:hypothetical protein BWQ92_22975 [Arthrobacter sp. QXT-31]
MPASRRIGTAARLSSALESGCYQVQQSLGRVRQVLAWIGAACSGVTQQDLADAFEFAGGHEGPAIKMPARCAQFG